MALFRSGYSNTNDFSPLFRLLDDYDAHRVANQEGRLTSWAPKFDVRENDNNYILDGELPGIDQKDINIEFTDPQTLLVKGHTEREYETPREREKHGRRADHRFWASERTVGDFQRVFSFPTRVDQDSVRASLKQGILNVTIPKAQTPSTKRIAIS